MTKRIGALLLMLLLVLPAFACAEDAYRMTGRIHPDLPEMAFEFTDTGTRTQDGEYAIRLRISSQDGFAQELTYRAYERANGYAHPQLEDVNFDGYLDLVLVHALGSSNAFSLFAPWQVDEGRFAEPIQEPRLCNYTLYPEEKRVLSSEKDGAASYHDRLYSWDTDGSLHLCGESIIESTDGGDSIRESLRLYGSGGQATICWDETYAASWYTAQRVWDERWDVLHQMLLGHAGSQTAVVANVEWVNLRSRDTKASPAFAKLDAGTEVTILADGCGEDAGWIRVYIPAPEGQTGRTGYIWHSFLEIIK